MTSTTALVTGASGLVGGAVVDALVARGVRVRALVRRPFARPGVEAVVVGSYAPAVVRDAVRDAVKDAGVDVVVHLGASGVKPDEQDALGLVDGNVGVTVALLQAVAARPPQTFIYASSSAVYGRGRGQRLREDDVRAPENVYGAVKVAAEDVGAVVARQLAVPFTVLRLFGVYGPGEAPHRMIPYLARALKKGERPALTPGAQQRDWIYVDDAAAAVVAALDVAAGVYNVCGGVGVDVKSVARAVGRAVFGKDVDDSVVGLGAKPYRSDEPMFVVGDPTRFLAQTRWAPTTTLDVGVARTVAWALGAAVGAAPA